MADCVRAAGRLAEALGHEVAPHVVRADVPMMMRAWTDIVAIGTALSVRGGLKGRPLSPDLVEGVSRGAVAHAEALPPTRYLQALQEIHAFGREMAAFLRSVIVSAAIGVSCGGGCGWPVLALRRR